MINFKICTRQALLSAFAVLSRIPLPKFEHTPNCVWAYPLVGVVLGALYVLVFDLLTWGGASPSVAIVGILIAMAILTGALHLDGLADTVDGICGGQDIKHRQKIMKDSHIGTYGVCILILAFLLYFTTLNSLAEKQYMIYPLMAVCVISRMGMGGLQMTTDTAKDTGTLACVSDLDSWQKQDNLYMIILLGTTISILFIGVFDTVYLMVCTGIIVYILRKIFMAKVGGVTGDTLGATQVILDITLLIIYSISL